MLEVNYQEYYFEKETGIIHKLIGSCYPYGKVTPEKECIMLCPIKDGYAQEIVFMNRVDFERGTKFTGRNALADPVLGAKVTNQLRSLKMAFAAVSSEVQPFDGHYDAFVAAPANTDDNTAESTDN